MEENGDATVTTTTADEIKETLMKGEAVQIVKIDDEAENHSFYLDEEALSKIMEEERIRDKPLCIVSVAGNFQISQPFVFRFH